MKHAEEGWLRYAEKSSKPYVPYVPAGWDPRPWRDPRPSFTFPTPSQWTAALTRVKSALDKYPKLGIPVKGVTKKMLLIYAWNEFGEGGIVAPTRGDHEMKLEASAKCSGTIATWVVRLCARASCSSRGTGCCGRSCSPGRRSCSGWASRSARQRV